MAVIDLDAAMEQGSNIELIKEILKFCECRVGGGIRDIETARELISLGAKKIIVGSKVFENDEINYDFLKELSIKIGKERIVVAIDSINKEIVTRGWKHKTGLQVFDVIRSIERYTNEFLFTCVEKEGLLQGTDVKTIKKLLKLTDKKITVAGGITSIDEIKELAKMGVNIQIGMAIYTGKIDPAEAFIESLNWKEDIIPTIVQDKNGQILMLAYSNKESLRKTFESNKMWYFSRSRNRLWLKGETSTNVQDLIKIRTDCDRDTLLATVKQKGYACHEGTYSCFGDKKFNLYELYDTVKDRIENPKPGSYTSKLSFDLLKEKILEEAREVIEAKSRDEIIWEISDILYFLIVFLAKNGVEIDDILFELNRRRKK